MLQAKSQDELKAYQDATAITDAVQELTAADAFAAKFPTSELRAALYIRAMNLYGQKNNAEKLIEAGRKAIAADPTNPVPLVQVASALAESTRETDLDREERYNEAAKDAHAAIDNVETGLIVPPNAPEDRIAGAKKSIVTMAYDTLGMVEMSKKDIRCGGARPAEGRGSQQGQPRGGGVLASFRRPGPAEEIPGGAGFGQQGGPNRPGWQPGAGSGQTAANPVAEVDCCGSVRGGGTALPSEIPVPAPPATPPQQSPPVTRAAGE